MHVCNAASPLQVHEGDAMTRLRERGWRAWERFGNPHFQAGRGSCRQGKQACQGALVVAGGVVPFSNPAY
jgi:hypothetical protein